MNLGGVLLVIWVLLVGLSWAGVMAIGTTFLGFWAIVTGIVLLVELWHPLPIFRRP